MLRARRRDVNVKPNRRLDRKSSRGMVYENEELRMRTITINEEVEKGQSDIKKLRRENEQLRREIWGLRDEYDRLEEIVEDLKDETDSEDASESDDEEDADVDENPENVENAVKEQLAAAGGGGGGAHSPSPPPPGGRIAAGYKSSEFDGLSVVDEETDDNQTASNDGSTDANQMGRFNTGLPSPSRIGWKYGNPANQQGPPGWKFGNTAARQQFQFPPPVAANPAEAFQFTPVPTQQNKETNMEGRFFARMPSQVEESPTVLPDCMGYEYATLPIGAQYDPNYGIPLNDNGFCGTIILPNGQEGVYYSDGNDPDFQTALPNWGPEAMLPNGQCVTVLPEQHPTTGVGRIGFSYSYYGNKTPCGMPVTSVYDVATPRTTDGGEAMLELYEARRGPDLMTTGFYPVAKPEVYRSGGSLDELMGAENGNVAVPAFNALGAAYSENNAAHRRRDAGSGHDGELPAREERRPGENDAASRSTTSSAKPPVPPKPKFLRNSVKYPSVEELTRHNFESNESRVLPGESDLTINSLSSENREESEEDSSKGKRLETQNSIVEFPDGDTRPLAGESDLVIPQRQVQVDLRKYSAILKGEDFELDRRESIISTTISTTVQQRGRQRVDDYVAGGQECESYRQPPAYLRLNSIRPHTLVFATAFPDLTVQEVIDSLDTQLAADLGAAVRGVRVVHGRCYICLARRHDVADLLATGLEVRGVGVQLEDASSGSVVVALDGVPHHVTDAAVAAIMANFGMVIGEVERRLYKGVDTGERLVRLKPGTRVSQRMPPTISVAGSQVKITLMPPQEVARLGFVGARDNTAPDSSSEPSGTMPRDQQQQQQQQATAASLDNSIDRFKTQLHVRLKTPDIGDGKEAAETSPGARLKAGHRRPASPMPGQYIASQSGNNPFAHQVTDHTNPTPQPIPNSNPFSPQYTAASAAADHLPVPFNPYQPADLLAPYPPDHFPAHPVNEHVNPTFNTYSPASSPRPGRKLGSPATTRKVEATAMPGGFPANSSYLHGAATTTTATTTTAMTNGVLPTAQAYSAQQNLNNAARSNTTEQLDVPVQQVTSVPNSPLAGRRPRPAKKPSTSARPRDDLLAHNQLSVSAPASRHQTAPNSPNVHRKNVRGARKMSCQSTNSNNIDNVLNEAERSVPNATSSPLTRHKGRKLSVSINESVHHNIVDVSRSSSSGQDSPTKVDRRRRVSMYFNNKKSSRRNSAAAVLANGMTRSVSLDPTRCRYGNQSLDGGGNEQTTTCSERERTNSVSSRGSSIGLGGGKRKSRHPSLRAFETDEGGKVPWCGCWGNGCI